jgi:hypothetical protein
MPSVQTHQISLLGVSASEDLLIKNFASYVSILFAPNSCRQVPQTNSVSSIKAPAEGNRGYACLTVNH